MRAASPSRVSRLSNVFSTTTLSLRLPTNVYSWQWSRARVSMESPVGILSTLLSEGNLSPLRFAVCPRRLPCPIDDLNQFDTMAQSQRLNGMAGKRPGHQL